MSKSDNTVQFKSIYDYLRGKVPGVNVSGANTINIRGYNSVNGSITPLFILNNTAVDQSVFGDVVPTTIKQIRVLKGPETATYGSRGANGVIIVETF
ncbi:TonB-dependent receptor plug domain-containing protein [Tenacibaculum sp. MAR_2009_124]|uniref:TonB-dependent receptor plug domain-containing protein n=1 Tax=Tenacibaculum sp. MAR_2009_124 TaxID=1250059 RepID=UPI000B869E1D